MAAQSASFAQHATIAFGISVTTVTAGSASPATDEVQLVVASGNNANAATGGTFTLTFDGQTTAGIAWNAANTAVVSALEALSNIGVGDVAVAGTSLTVGYTVTFQGALAATNVAEMTADGASVTAAAYCDVVTLTSPHSGTLRFTNRAATNTLTVKVVDRGAAAPSTIAALADNTYLVHPTGVTGLDAFLEIAHGGSPVDVYVQCPAKQAYSVESLPGKN